MKEHFLRILLIFSFSHVFILAFSQNLGVGIATPAAKVHIKGSLDAPQLVIDADTTQANTNPLIKLRKSDGTDLMWIHSDNPLNLFVGLNAGRVNSNTGEYNTFIGSDAGYSNTTGGYNVACGRRALYANTSGIGNTAIGNAALYHNTIGQGNTANGQAALYYNVSGDDNTACGSAALHFNSTGYQNTAIGQNALFHNSTGHSNTASGYQALYANTTGVGNTANGVYTLSSNSVGSYNTAYGYQALYANTSGYDNTANGIGALTSNTTGIQNTALGANALVYNSTGNYNTATGAEALQFNTGSYNTANGFRALYGNTTGYDNTAVGYYALFSNTTAYGNTATGLSALHFNNTGVANTATGSRALYYNTTGYNNTAMGYYALFTTSASSYNTAFGYAAGENYNNGWSNVFVGSQADVSAAGLGNVIAIGENTIVSSSNTARFGNSATNSYGGWANWTDVSDGRFKRNIEENIPGVEFINLLRPISYTLAATEMDAFLHRNDVKDSPRTETTNTFYQQALLEKEQIRYTGFIAQEVEEAARSLGFDFSGVDAAKNENDLYGLRYAEFVVPLVKAVQEQQALIEEMKEKIKLLQKENRELRYLIQRVPLTANY